MIASPDKGYTYDKLDRVTKVTYPDAETIEFAYNHDGTVDMRTDQRGIDTYYSYDNLGRMTDKQADLDGDLDAEFTEIFTYDGLGRMLTATKYDEEAAEYISQSAFSYNGIGCQGALKPSHLK